MEQLTIDGIRELLGDDSKGLLGFNKPKIPQERLILTGENFVQVAFGDSDRSEEVKRNLQRLYSHGRLSRTGYLSILPVDQDIEHGAGVSFEANPIYFDPENLFRLAMEGGCNAFASTLEILASCSKKYADRIPLIAKINHNETLTFPLEYDQVMFGNVEKAKRIGAAGVGATIYFGSPQSRRQIQEVAEAFEKAHELGMFTVAWCYLRSDKFKVEDGGGKVDYHASADLTGQANHLGVTLGADIIKQKQATNNRGYSAVGFSNSLWNENLFENIVGDHPIDFCRYQVVNCYAGRRGMINSGGASGDNDQAQAVRTAVINKRAGGQGLISGRKAFKKPIAEGIQLLHSIQDVYLCNEVTIA